MPSLWSWARKFTCLCLLIFYRLIYGTHHRRGLSHLNKKKHAKPSGSHIITPEMLAHPCLLFTIQSKGLSHRRPEKKKCSMYTRLCCVYAPQLSHKETKLSIFRKMDENGDHLVSKIRLRKMNIVGFISYTECRFKLYEFV